MTTFKELGRGLGSLIPPRSTTTAGSSGQRSKEVLDIPLDKITGNPRQPRSKIGRRELEDLVNSIKEHGIIQPLLVSPSRHGYELIAGERRFQAAKLLGLKTVPVIVRPSEEVEKLELALIENIQRENLNAIDRARAFHKLINDFGFSQDDIAKKIGQSRSQVANTIRLLNLPEEIKQAIIDGRITEGHAKALLSLATPEEQLAYLKKILIGGLTVREIEGQVHQVNVKAHRRFLKTDPQVAEYESRLASTLGTKVKITRRRGRGRIAIEFFSDEELDSIIRKIIS